MDTLYLDSLKERTYNNERIYWLGILGHILEFTRFDEDGIMVSERTPTDWQDYAKESRRIESCCTR